MTTYLRKYSTLISILLIPILFISGWLFPSAGRILLILSLGFGLFINSLMIVKKHRESYSQGKISRTIFVRNVSLEILGILLAMILASVLGRYVAEVATRQIDNDLTKVFAGVLVALLVGVAVGVLIKRTWNGLQRVATRSDR
jgi:hypothetical protein